MLEGLSWGLGDRTVPTTGGIARNDDLNRGVVLDRGMPVRTNIPDEETQIKIINAPPPGVIIDGMIYKPVNRPPIETDDDDDATPTIKLPRLQGTVSIFGHDVPMWLLLAGGALALFSTMGGGGRR